ncbi:Hypothetical protein FKW44_010386, partial [Caligus rogercresseyi]
NFYPQFPTNFDEKDLVAIDERMEKGCECSPKNLEILGDRTNLQELQSRRKGLRPAVNLKPGDYVLIRDKLLKRNQWPLDSSTKSGQVQTVKLGRHKF